MSSESNSYELVYFEAKGSGNMIRILLEDHSVEYKFTPVDPEEWPKLKPKTPLGFVPVLIVNGSTHLAQSHTIMRYLGRELKLMGANSLESAQIEMYIDQCVDVRNKFTVVMYTNYEKGLQPFLESIPELLAPFEKKLGESESKKHLVLNKLTIADYVLFDLLHVLLALSSDCIDKLENLKAFYQSFGSREKLKAYLDQPEVKAMKFTGSGHL